MKIAIVLFGLLSLVEFSGAFFFYFGRSKTKTPQPKCRTVRFLFFTRKVCNGNNNNKVNSNPSSDYCVCSGSGDPHYKTFDGATIHFMGICKYTLAKLLDKTNKCYLNVEVKNEHRGFNKKVAYTRLVDVKIQNYVIRLHQGRRVFINKMEKFLPVTLTNGVAITRSGNNVVVKTVCGAEIMFDGNHVVTVKIPKQWGANKMNGICGSCNGNSKDDFMTLEGVNVARNGNKYNLIGNSYRVPDDSDQPHFQCKRVPPFPVCTAQQMTLFQDSPQYCGLLKNQGGSFADCIKSNLVDMDGYMQSCKMDLCANYQSALEEKTICESLESAAKDCANKGILIDWRQPTFCPMTCGANEEYKFQAPGCEATCVNDDVSNCVDPPSEGCVCKSGFVRSGNACVKKSECGCVDNNGDYYPMGSEKRTENCGEVFQCKFVGGKSVLKKIQSGITCHKDATCGVQNGEHTCVCKQGYAGDGIKSCINLKDRCTCTGSGDPHYYLFDGQRIDFMGVCMYTLSELTQRANECWFSVEVKNERRGWNWNVAWTRMVDFAIYGQKVRILSGRRVQINGRTKYLPIELAGGKMRVFFNGNNVQVDTDCGITVMFDGYGKVVVNVPSHLGNLLQGICGNCNGRQDDFRTKDGADVSNDRNRFNLIGMSYSVVDDSDAITKGCTPPIDPPKECPAALAQAITGDDMCGMIKDTAGPFRECILAGVVDVEQYFDSCRSDICQYDGGKGFTTEELVCDSLSAFAAVCNNYGYEIFWRTADMCPLPCGPNEVYTTAANPCPETCNGRITGAACNGPRVEGCQCKPGFVMSSDMCVPKAKCGCKDNQGNYYPIGAGFRSKDCSTVFSCKKFKGKGKLVSEVSGQKCHKYATCGVKDGEMRCVCKEGYAGDGVYSCIDTTPKCRCSATGDPHYKTYDGQMIHFQGTCRYTLTQSTTTNDECAFNVEVKNENRHGNSKVSWTKMVALEMYGLEILLLGENKVLIDREEKFLPFSMKGGKLRVSLVAGKVQVDTECGISLSFDGVQDVIVEVPKEYANKMTGICGDCDGEKNDWKTKEGDDLSEYEANERDTDIGNSYIVEEDYYPSDEKCSIVKPLPGCGKVTYRKFAGTDYCGYIIDITGPFKECIQSGMIETEGYFESCRKDLCAYKKQGHLNKKKVVCKAMTSFAAACNAEGFVSIWRTEEFCPLECPKGQVYSTSVSACPPTCGEPAPEKFCEKPAREGCQCKEGFVLNDKKCTKKQDCGCTDEEGNYMPVSNYFRSGEI
ncbi:zonadhesin-like [Liolophura sinensis]|uniref:zonadhesin-like n=1 Tax=Liolophura sinensis TaxID=3198878 RepID=UPI00315960F2